MGKKLVFVYVGNNRGFKHYLRALQIAADAQAAYERLA